MIARDIYSFLILINQLQIHEDAIEIGLNLKSESESYLYVAKISRDSEDP